MTQATCGYEVLRPDAVSDVVPFAVWLAAERTLLHCTRDLGLSPSIEIKWIRPTHTAIVSMEQTMERLAHLAGKWDVEAQAFLDGPLTGQARSLHDKEIRVRADLSRDETMRTVAHELQHLADYGQYRWPRTDEEHVTFEARARAYENRMAAVLGYA